MYLFFLQQHTYFFHFIKCLLLFVIYNTINTTKLIPELFIYYVVTKIGMLLQKITDTKGVGISNMRKSIYILTTPPASHTHRFHPHPSPANYTHRFHPLPLAMHAGALPEQVVRLLMCDSACACKCIPSQKNVAILVFSDCFRCNLRGKEALFTTPSYPYIR